jgi:hypothetical protein
MKPALSQRLLTFICFILVFLLAAPTNACLDRNCLSQSASNFFQQPLCATESSFLQIVARFVSKNTLRDYAVGNDSSISIYTDSWGKQWYISWYWNYTQDLTNTSMPKAPNSNVPSTTPLSGFYSLGLGSILTSLLGTMTLPITSFRHRNGITYSIIRRVTWLCHEDIVLELGR